MRIFIPEGFIYFYVYGTGFDNLFSIFYGSIDVTTMPSYFFNTSIYDIWCSDPKKIRWGRGWKAIYFRRESPFFINLAINDRHNWAYSHTIYKLLTDKNGSIFLTQCSLLKGYRSAQSIPFQILTYKKGLGIEDINDVYLEFLTDSISHRILSSLVHCVFVRESFSNDHDHAYRYQLIQFAHITTLLYFIRLIILSFFF